ncbi:MAG: SDR family NAD(P)-dependent oxidoreductase [Candidatus Syntropharchaeales archaeon]
MVDILKDKVAVITGSGRGIGRAAAIRFVEEGAMVVVNDIDEEPANETVKEIEKMGGKAIACVGDVCDKAFDQEMIDTAVKEFGKIDILVNNAGYTWDATVHNMTDEMFDAMIDVHLKAPYYCIQAVAKYMRKKDLAPDERGGKIVNITSIAGVMGNAGQANYSSAKAGLIGLTRTIAREWGAFRVNCNVIAYGVIDTRLTQEVVGDEKPTIKIKGHEIPVGIPKKFRDAFVSAIPLRYIATPYEAAGPIVFLASDYANYITGQLLLVTGGLLMNE